MNDLELKINIEIPLAYAARGWRIFPCHSFFENICTCDRADCSDVAKHPLTEHGFRDATADADTIRRWYGETDGLCNWALATGSESGVFVLDIDPRHGGNESMQGRLLPPTLRAETGGGGEHVYFRWTPGVRSRNGVLKGLDIRGDGGYVLLPPSLHRSGKRYAWQEETPIADAPPWLLQLLSVGQTLTVQAGTPDLSNSPGVGEGERNATLCRLIGVHLARGESLDRIEPLALVWAEKCSPPFPEQDVRKALRALAAKHQQQIHTPPILNASVSVGTLRTNEESPEPDQSQGLSSFVRTGNEQSPDAGQSQAGDFLRSFVDDWPTLHADALHGLAGEIIQAIEPETEADPAGILLQLLVCVGSAVGSGAYFRVGNGRHHANLFALIVGDTVGGKGMALDVALDLAERSADPDWKKAIHYGLSSGEGLLERVADADLEPVSDGGSVSGFTATAPKTDKRLLAVETEFAQVFRTMRREGNTLSPLLRNAWDGKTLELLTRKKNALRSEGAHIGIIGHITPDELRKCLDNSVEIVNGFSNRFLFALVRRSKLLPHGGNPTVLDRFREPLRIAIETAKAIGEVRRSAEADRLWESVYADLSQSRNGAFGRATERARPQVMRLALVYALLDGSAEISVLHLRAALAVWNYCEASARMIFREESQQQNTTSPLEQRLLNRIIAEPGVSRTGLHEATGRNVSAEDLARALTWLHANGHAHPESVSTHGRPSECWYPGRVRTNEESPEPVRTNEESPVRTNEESPVRTNEESPEPGLGEGKSPFELLTDVNNLPPISDIPNPGSGLSSFVRTLTLTLAELLDQVRSQGGRFKWVDGWVVVDSIPITTAIDDAVQFYQADLARLVPKPTPEPSPEPESTLSPEERAWACKVDDLSPEGQELFSELINMPQ